MKSTNSVVMNFNLRYVLAFLSLCVFISINMVIVYSLNGSFCDNTLLLAKQVAYYEELLHQRKSSIDLVLTKQKNSGQVQKNKTGDSPTEQKTVIFERKKLLTTFPTPKTKDDSVYRGPGAGDVSFTKKRKGLVMDWWMDICIQRTSSEQIWHPLFPKYPQNTTIASQTGDADRRIGHFFRRIYGYLHTKETGIYDFKLLSRDGAEVLLLDSQLKLPSADDISGPSSTEYVEKFHLKLTTDLMDYQDKRIELSQMFETEKRNVHMKANHLYYIEILQGGKYFAKYQLQWRLKGQQYKIIKVDNLFYTSGMSALMTPSQIREKYHLVENYRVKELEMRRLSFYKTPVLRPFLSTLNHSSLICPVLPPDYKNITKLYGGLHDHVDEILTYPKEQFDHKVNSDMSRKKDKDLVMDANLAKLVGHKTFEAINNIHNNTLHLHHIVHIQTNVNQSYHHYANWNRTYYFVELDVKILEEDKIHRVSKFVRLFPSGNICFMEDYQWDSQVDINLLTPIRNQVVWLKYLVQMLEHILEMTNENNVRLILIDCSSTDGDYLDILKRSRLKFKYLRLPAQGFSKVKSLNHGLKHVKQANSVAFVLDLHLQLPLNIFDRIRKFTIQGRTGYSPTLMKLACGEHEQYTVLKDTKWLDWGTGMMAMYMTDWIEIGGFNEKLYDRKWGGEDWEVIDRMYTKGLFLIHGRLPRFYHIHHSRDKMWDKKG